MSPIGLNEKGTRERVIRLFRDTLEYDYLGSAGKGRAGTERAIDSGVVSRPLEGMYPPFKS